MNSMDMVLDSCARAHPDRLAITLGDRAASFGDVASWVSRYAGALRECGVRHGQVVLVCCETSLDLVYLHHAMARIGAIFAPVDPNCSEQDLAQTIDYVTPHLLIADERRQAMAEQVALRAGVSLAIVAAHDGPVAGIHLSRAARFHRGDDRADRPQPDDVQVMYFTSGSTGQPKAAMISHRANWLRAHLAPGTCSSQGMVCMFPLFHMAGWQVIAQCWARRRAVHLVHRADAEQLLGAIERWQASTLYAIPAVWKRILDCRKSFDLSSLRDVDAGTSYVGPDLIHALRARFPGTHNLLGYGSTEMGMGLQIAHEDILRKPGSVGLPAPTLSAKIVDGELWLRGPTMMEGYFRRPSETAEAMVDGWYRTGDLAECDGEGYHMIVGRRREIIRSGGETISPIELDMALKRIDGVADIAAVGVPHPDWGEIVSVAVVAHDGQPAPTLEHICAQLGGLSKFKLPRALYEVAAIPRTPATGQVRRNHLREIISLQSHGVTPARPPETAQRPAMAHDLERNTQ